MSPSARRYLVRNGSIEAISGAAKKLYDGGELVAAEELLEAAVKRSDSTPGTYANLGHVKFALGDYQGAIPAYDRAIDTFPDVGVGRGLANERLGNLEAAQIDYRKALEHDPDDVDALVNLGTLLLAADEADAAYPLLARAAELDPSAVWTFGDALLAVGRQDEARRAYERALQEGELRAHLDLARLDDAVGLADDAELHYQAAVAAGATLARPEFAEFLFRKGRPDAARRVADEDVAAVKGDDPAGLPGDDGAQAATEQR
jgi:tetratricopeptide (TPR) repeat protein